LNDGSSIDLGGDMRYTSGFSSENILPAYAAGGCGPVGAVSCAPYAYVDAQVIGDGHITWSSADQKYTVTGYVRNIGNNAYKNSGLLSGENLPPPAGLSVNPHNSFNATATTYQPRTLGIVVTGKF